MGIWQFRFTLVPTAELSRRYGTVPLEIAQSAAEEITWWIGHPKQPIEKTISTLLIETNSWSPHLRIWGHEQSDNITIGYDDAHRDFEFVQVELDAHTVNHQLIDNIAALAKKHDLSPLSRTGKILSAERTGIKDAVQSSIAARFVADPEATLKSLPKP